MKDLTITVTLGAYCSVGKVFLTDAVLNKLREAFTLSNPAYGKAKAMGFRKISEPSRYYLFREEQGLFQVWRGGAKRLKAVLNQYGIQVRWLDQRKVFNSVGLTFGSMKPRPNQLAMAQDMIRYQQGIGVGKTGMGKTETGLTAIIMSGQPSLVVVWNKDLLAQWEERIIKYGILPKREIGIIQGPKNKFGLITIAMIQTLHKRVDEWTGRFGCVLMDECQRAPATTFTKGIIPFPAKFRWGLSADPERQDKKHFLAYEAFGYQEWSSQTRIPKYEPIHTAEGDNNVLDPDIIIRPTAYENEKYEEEKNYNNLINEMVRDEERNELIMQDLRRELEAGAQCILFTERTETAQWWASEVASWGFTAGPLIGGTKNAEHTKSTIKLLQSGKCRFASTTSYADVGLDVPSLEAAFITCPTGGNDKRINQQIGRIRRPDPKKKSARAYYYWDKNIEGISKHIRTIRRKFVNVIEDN